MMDMVDKAFGIMIANLSAGYTEYDAILKTPKMQKQDINNYRDMLRRRQHA